MNEGTEHPVGPGHTGGVTGSPRYRLPDGVEIESHDGSTVTFRVTMPADDAGHIGRQCPSCKQLFRMHADDYAALPDDQPITCPYCGFADARDEFMTAQQLERAKAAAGGLAQQLVVDQIGRALDDVVRSINRSSSKGGIFSMSASRSSSRPHLPSALPTISEPAPIRERQCARCSNRYAIFGQHVACPACGALPPKTLAEDALAAQTAILDALGQLEPAALDNLRELGAIDATVTSTLATVVSALETYLRATFNDRVNGADQLTAGRGNIFQRLDDVRSLFREHLGIDLAVALGSDWERLRLLYGIRHLQTHTNGIVDAKHLQRFPNFPIALGQRVTVSLVDARDAIRCGQRLLDLT